jgi:hypothetical protein
VNNSTAILVRRVRHFRGEMCEELKSRAVFIQNPKSASFCTIYTETSVFERHTVLEDRGPVQLQHHLVGVFVLFDITHGWKRAQGQQRAIANRARRGVGREGSTTSLCGGGKERSVKSPVDASYHAFILLSPKQLSTATIESAYRIDCCPPSCVDPLVSCRGGMSKGLAVRWVELGDTRCLIPPFRCCLV